MSVAANKVVHSHARTVTLGDVRVSQVKRVAYAVGEGSVAIAFTHKVSAAGCAVTPTSTATRLHVSFDWARVSVA